MPLVRKIGGKCKTLWDGRVSHLLKPNESPSIRLPARENPHFPARGQELGRSSSALLAASAYVTHDTGANHFLLATTATQIPTVSSFKSSLHTHAHLSFEENAVWSSSRLPGKPRKIKIEEISGDDRDEVRFGRVSYTFSRIPYYSRLLARLVSLCPAERKQMTTGRRVVFHQEIFVH
ncbi:hypothetical protein OUZ56_002645 [Daphnia magna]|uniref:Uncharacterized protein n=1 Tax=Daphnia magna TaxID=35525 RepID=A0ABR0A6C4_9CRUS|nr:hypothetical protein OUZ56_002645 [Daphnia magna]